MRANQEWADRAREIVRQEFPAQVLAAHAEHVLMPESLRRMISQMIENDYSEEDLEAIHEVLAGAVLAPLMSAAEDGEPGGAAAFMREVNSIRSGFVSADLTNEVSYEQLFPEVAERFGPEDGPVVLGGLRSHVVGLFSNAAHASGSIRRFVDVLLQRASEFDGADVRQDLVVVGGERLTAEHILHAVDAMSRVTDSAGMELQRGLKMILGGYCEFVGGAAALAGYIREMNPAVTLPELQVLAGRAQSYLAQFGGDLVNDVIRDIGCEWVANHAAAYLEAERRVEYDDEPDDDDFEYYEDEMAAPLLLEDDASFRM